MKWIIRIIISLFASIAFAQVVDVVPVPMSWLVSYETIGFDTPDGDLGMNEYALNGNEGWYIRTIDSSVGQFESTTSIDTILGKKKVNIICEKCRYYSEFYTKDRSIKRFSMQKNDYDGLRTIKDYPRPSRNEFLPLASALYTNAGIIYRSSNNSGALATVSSASFTHTVNSGSNQLLAIRTMIRDATDADRDISDITYNSISLTQIREDDNSNSQLETGIWYLVAPTTGSNTVSVTYAGTVTASFIMASTFDGINQSNPVDTHNGGTFNTDGANAIVTSITTSTSGGFAIDIVTCFDSPACSGANLSTEQTLIQAEVTVGVSKVYASHRSQTITPAGAKTMGWSDNTTNGWAHSVAVLSPIVTNSRVVITGFEGGHDFCSARSGTTASDTSIVHTGKVSLRINPVSGASGACNIQSYSRGTGSPAGALVFNTTASSTTYYKFYFYAATLPNAAGSTIFSDLSDVGGTKYYVLTNASGDLSTKSGTTQIGATSSAAITTGQWYRIEFRSHIATASTSLRVDGTEIITGGVNIGSSKSGTLQFGRGAGNQNNGDIDFYYDDVAVDDTGYPGASVVEALHPDANGSTMQWTAGTCGSNYEAVDEWIVEDVCYAQSTTQNDVALFSLENTATTSISGTIYGVRLQTRARENVSGTSNLQFRLKDGATNLDTSGLDTNTVASPRGIDATTSPASGIAWTTTDLNGLEGGFVDAGTTVLRGTHVQLEVDYIPAVGGDHSTPLIDDGQWWLLFE